MNKITIYQLLPRLFANYKKTYKINGRRTKNGCGKLNDITSKALYELKELGTTHIWFTGILEHACVEGYSKIKVADGNAAIIKGMAGSPYAIKDYFDIAPDLAEKPAKRMQEFEELLTRTHSQGLKAIMDFVPNHVARVYKSDAKPVNAEDFGANDDTNIPFSTENDFYYIKEKLEITQNSSKKIISYEEFPTKATGNDRFSHIVENTDWYDTVKLNYGINYFSPEKSTHFTPIPSVWKKMKTILHYWAEKGIDGFRCDMVEMVPVEFWEWVIPQIKETFPQVIFIAEIYDRSKYESYIKQGKFDYLYDKDGLYDTLREILQYGKSANLLTKVWQDLGELTPKMLRFLENHDEQRLASKHFLANAYQALPAMLVSATMHKGAVMIYAGQEVGEPAEGISGYSGDDGRTTIFDYWAIPELQKWANKGLFDGKKLATWQTVLRNEYRKILELTKHKAVAEGAFYDLMYANESSEGLNPHYIYAYIRHSHTHRLLFAVNFHKEDTQEFYLKIPEHTFEVMEIPNMAQLFGKEILAEERTYIKESKETLINKGVLLKVPAQSYKVYQLEFGL